MTSLLRPTTREREDHALGVLLNHLRKTTGEDWSDQKVPEGARPTFDRILINETTGQRIALETTSFDWPLQGAEIRSNLAGIARALEQRHKDRVSGSYTLSANINSIDEAKLFRGERRGRRQASLDVWFSSVASTMRLRQTLAVADVPSLTVTRQALQGDLRVTLPVSSANIEYPDCIIDLEAVIEGNVTKFDGVIDMPRWLLITYPGIGDYIKTTHGNLTVPPAIDKLLFVDQMDRSNEWPPRNPDMVYWIVEYPTTGRNKIEEVTHA
jgi:hypothetical protein